MNKLSVFHHRPCRNAEALQVIYTNAYTTGMLGSASKTVNGVVHDYYYVGDRLQYEKFGTREMWFFYDADGNPSGFKYQNGSTVYNYYYVCNWRGDVVALYANDGLKYTYEYDVWGKMLAIRNVSGEDVTGAANIANYNPLRYRGYYYDDEIGLYYLHSRYYNPDWQRFINGDILIAIDNEKSEHNIFNYCFNNPVNYDDCSGCYSGWDDVTALIAGGGVNVCITLIEDFTSGSFSDIETYLGSFVGGAIGGWCSLYYPSAGGAVSNGLSTLVTESLLNRSGKGNYQPDEMLFDTLISAGEGLLLDAAFSCSKSTLRKTYNYYVKKSNSNISTICKKTNRSIRRNASYSYCSNIFNASMQKIVPKQAINAFASVFSFIYYEMFS